MIHPDFKFLRSVCMMIGAVVGVGVFGIPFSFAQSGVAIGLLELFILGIIMIILQLMFAEIALQTSGKHRLVGYIDLYLGPFWKKIATAAVCANGWGAILAYMIIGGSFLHLLLAPVFGGPAHIYSYFLALIAGFFIYLGLKVASRLEIFVIGTLLFLFVFMILLSFPHIQISNIFKLHWSNAFVPYGIILFALSSMGIVPEMKEVLGSRAKSQLGSAILIGMLIVIVLYALFGTALVGVTGQQTTQAVFEGLTPIFGETFRVVASILGIITVLSVFIMLGIQLMNIVRVDLHRSHKTAWAMAIFIPVLLFGFGFREFVDLIGFIGSVFGGLLGILIVFTYLRMQKTATCRIHHCFKFPPILSWIVIGVFLTGIVFKFYQFLL
ncbi:MAG: aromatic amino acid transport family protein [Patescibacteria group bacterium]